MPIPKVICCICGQEVNKAQTLHIGDGKRACKSHEGTIEASQRERQKIAQQKHDEAVKLEDKKKRKPFTLKPHCMICGEEGIYQEEWYTRMMVELKKYEITHGQPINPFTDDIRKACGVLADVPCLFYVLWHGTNTKIKIPLEAYQFTQLQKSFGIDEPILTICHKCVAKKNFISFSQERIEAIEADNFLTIAEVMHTVIEPEIMKIAIREISESN
jgi:hypothetical protein